MDRFVPCGYIIITVFIKIEFFLNRKAYSQLFFLYFLSLLYLNYPDYLPNITNPSTPPFTKTSTTVFSFT